MQTQQRGAGLGERIRSARRLAGLSQRELARRVGVTAMAISKYETGKMVPGSSVLLKLAEALGVDMEFFLRPGGVRVEAVSYRKHPSLSKRDQGRAEAAAAEWIERYLEVEQLAGVGVETDAVLGDPFDVSSDPDVEEAALRLRERWCLGKGPISSMVGLLEDHGFRVGVIELPDTVDAMVFKIGDGSCAVVLREGIPGDRQRFSLAHDLGHLVLRFKGGVDEEAACHRFAAAFLVPAEAARRELGDRRRQISLLELHDLKQKYGMSMAAWIKRARELGIIPVRRAREILAEFRRKGWDRVEPGTPVPAERPGRMERLLTRLVEEGVIGSRRASELLGQPWEEFLRSRSEDSGGLPVVAGL